MQTQDVQYWSGGQRVQALWRFPENRRSPLPAIIHAPGWFGLADHVGYEPYHEALTKAGFGVLAPDYRGFGQSDGEPGRFSPSLQLEDLLAGVSYLCTRPDVLEGAIGTYGGGGTGGGNVVMLAAADPRIRVVVSQVPVADGADWLHRMRTEYDWIEFLSDLERDRRERALTGHGRLVHPRRELMVETPERRLHGGKEDVDVRMPDEVPLAIADEILRYRPVDVAAGIRVPLMVIAVENDATVPTDHAESIFERASGPKRFVLQRGTSHYLAYERYEPTVIPMIVEWFERYLHPEDDIVVRDDIRV
jgi:pimeloyl-ACP methyl ester carboxylesterase